MKKLLILLAFVPLVSFGQFSKGTKYVGGSMSYNSLKVGTGDGSAPASSYLAFQGQLGIFINESIAIGPIANFFSSSNHNLNPVTNLYENMKITGIAGGLFARKFFSISESFFFSLEGKGLVGTINRDLNSSLFEESSTRLHISLLPAFTFMPNQKWSFDASIGDLSYQSNWNANFIEDRNFNVNFGQVSLGLNYFFGRN